MFLALSQATPCHFLSNKVIGNLPDAPRVVRGHDFYAGGPGIALGAGLGKTINFEVRSIIDSLRGFPSDLSHKNRYGTT